MANNLEYSVSELRSRLSALKAVGGSLFLSRVDIAKALKAFIASEIDAEEIAAWAEFYDANDGVVFEQNPLIPDVIFDLSSPEINGQLDEERAKHWLNLLED